MKREPGRERESGQKLKNNIDSRTHKNAYENYKVMLVFFSSEILLVDVNSCVCDSNYAKYTHTERKKDKKTSE